MLKAAGAGNSSIAAAMNVSAQFSFAENADIADATTRPHVTISATGGGYIDYYAVTIANPGSSITLDIDYGDQNGAPGDIDTIVVIYNSAGQVLDWGDDWDPAEGGGGSVSGLDSFLRYTFAAAGTYYVAVETWDDEVVPSGGTYQLHISVGGEILENPGGGTIFRFTVRKVSRNEIGDAV